MRRLILFIAILVTSLNTMAEVGVRFKLLVGSTDHVTLLDSFPESYSASRVSISIDYRLISEEDSTLNQFDFVFTDRELPQMASFGSAFLTFTDANDVEWTVWRNTKALEKKKQKTERKNAYKAFETYVRESLGMTGGDLMWLVWVCAGLLLAAVTAYIIVTIIRRRKEKYLSSVEQEILRRKRLGKRRHYASQLYLWLLLAVMYAPILFIVVFSFTKNKILGNWSGFSFDLYVNLFTGKAGTALNNALINTLLIALIAAGIATILGTLAAIGIYNMRARNRKAISFLNSVPMINPDIITGISLFLLFVALGVSRGMTTVIIAHIVFCTPYVVLSVLPRLSQMNPNTYEAALDLGATPFQALRKVMMPELWPGMLSGFVLALTLSVDDFGVTFFTKGSCGLDTLSTYIYADACKSGLTPELRPLFTVILLVILTGLIIINIRASKNADKQLNNNKK